MRYVALLRAINVGGRNAVTMAALAACLEQQGFGGVATYLNTGNVVFDAAGRSTSALTARIERALAARFGFPVPVVLQSAAQLRAVVAGAPADWSRRRDLRRNIAFLKPPLTAARAMADVEAREDVDAVTPGKGVLYLSTVMSALGRSRLSRLITTPIYRDMTIRSYDTCRKVVALLDRPTSERPAAAHRPSGSR
jgi:uncharacterized protein (DUF1697 family)